MPESGRVPDDEHGPNRPTNRSGGGGRGRLRPVAINLAVLAITLGVGVLATEAILRIFPSLLPEETALRMHWRAIAADESAHRGEVIVPDERIGYLYKPFVSREIVRNDLRFSYTTDERGFRNPSPWPARADIVVVGDSMAFGYGVDLEEGWPSLLDRNLPDERVVSLGLPGLAPQQSARIYERFGEELDPDLLIFTIFPGNDIHDARTFAAWEEAQRPMPYHVWKSAGGGGRSAGLVERVSQASYVAALLRQSVKAVRTPLENRKLEMDDGTVMHLTPTVFASSARSAVPGDPDLERVVHAAMDARERALAADAGFVVLLMPTKERIYMPALGEETPDLLGAFLQRFAELDVPVIDPTDDLRARARARDGERLYFPLDGHPDVAGNDAIAKTILRFLRDRPELAGIGVAS